MRIINVMAELIEEQEAGYSAYCPDLDIYSQGDDVEDALHNLQEACELHLEEVGPAGVRPVIRRELEMTIVE